LVIEDLRPTFEAAAENIGLEWVIETGGTAYIDHESVIECICKDAGYTVATEEIVMRNMLEQANHLGHIMGKKDGRTCIKCGLTVEISEITKDFAFERMMPCLVN